MIFKVAFQPKKMASKAAKLTLKRHKGTGSIYHEESGLVFKSATEKLVTGRIQDDALVEFDETAYALCQQFGFKPDPELIQEEEQEAPAEESAAAEEVPEPKVEPKVESKPVQKTETKAVPKAEPKPEPVPKAEHKAEPVPKAEPETDPTTSLNEAFNLIQKTIKQVQKENGELKKQLEDAHKKLAKYAATIKSLTELNA